MQIRPDRGSKHALSRSLNPSSKLGMKLHLVACTALWYLCRLYTPC